MEKTITLLDGDHVLKTPSYYGLQLIDEYGMESTSIMASLPTAIAALLTDSEPLDAKGMPSRTWYPVQVAKLIPTDSKSEDLWEVITALIEDAVPDTDGPVEERPTPRPGD